MKKYVPSGYQILSIDVTRVDENNHLLEETEDEKVLYDLMRNGKLDRKPILLQARHGNSGFVLTGFVIINGVSIQLSDIVLTDGVIDGYTIVKLGWTGEKVVVEVQEA